MTPEQRAGLLSFRTGETDQILLSTIISTDLPQIQASAAWGDARSAALLETYSAALHKVATASRFLPARCDCCHRNLRRKSFFITVSLPANRVPSTPGVAIITCGRCAPDMISARALAAKLVMQDFEVHAIDFAPGYGSRS